MKKIISLLAAVSLFSTMFVANVSASEEDTVKLTSTVTSISVDEYKTAVDETSNATLTDEKYDAYKVVVDIENIGTVSSTIVSGRTGNTYKGRQINGLNYKVSFDDVSGMHKTDYAMGLDSKYDQAKFGATDSAKWTTDTAYGVSVATPFPGLTTADTTYTDKIDGAVILYFAIEKGKVANATIDGPIVTLCEYDKSAPAAGAANERHTPALNNITANGFTIGTQAKDPVLDKVVISGATATTLTVGDEVTLTAKAYNDDETEKAAAIAWTVEGDAVTVADGLVKAVKEGTATVTATAVDGEITKSASVTFTVETEKLPALPEVTVAGGDVAGQEVKSGENTIGYLWKAIFNAATIKDKYIATFKSGAETNAATLKGFAAQNIEGEGNVSVIVALNTAKAAVTLGITE